MKKSTRKLKAKETLEIIDNGYYQNEKDNTKIDISKEIEFCISNTKYYSSQDLDNELNENQGVKRDFVTEFGVKHEDSVSSIIRLSEYSKTMCLNFASAKNPGGGFLNGALAQEESLAVSSALYGSQMSVFDFYETHRNMKSCVYTDGMIHSPDVPFFRNKNGELLATPVKCGIITSAAVNLGVVKLREVEVLDQVPTIMNKRIEKLLTLCEKYNYETLILGAWGCGVFQNDPKVIAKLFHQQFNGRFKNKFKKVVFAIYSRNEKFIEAFNELF